MAVNSWAWNSCRAHHNIERRDGRSRASLRLARVSGLVDAAGPALAWALARAPRTRRRVLARSHTFQL